ncbi:unnamed protein product [Phaedon cochleariae]|uniref:Double jelly roll-like domain-containing protein n=1 Tax=Phaedon cochleariae TaxID=80249 RepID=A0A9N9SJ93_PHACE|nr:unnamed protein product [Phaedon cochleariae]
MKENISVKVVERANTALQGSPQTQSIAKITIESINLKVPHLTPNDDIKLQLLTRIKADESMMIPFRRWELHELPALTQGSTIEIWSVKTCSALDSPRYVIVFFQTKKADNLHEDVTLFDNANIKSIRLALNSDYYPQERMLLDFSRDQYADAHFNYTEFNKSYHNCQEKRSLVNFAEFKSRPMFVIDCSRRHLGLKSSTVDINLQLEVFDEPIFDHSLISLHEHTYKPYGSPSFKNSDEIRIAVNFQDLILDISDSYIYIEGKFTPDDATKSCYLSNNTLAFLFDEIRYEMGGEQVCMIRKPGITTTMKSMISYGDSNAKFLETVGWGIDSENQPILDKSSHIFSGKLPLKYLMGFAEDYNKGILNVKQELILIIARSFKNCYIGEVDASVEINKIEWKIGHIMPSDKQRLKLLNRLNKSSTAKVKIAYRMWDLYELPSIRETSSDIWAVKTTNSLERPRYIIIGFQNSGNTDNRSKDTTQFIHAGVNNIRLYLNSEVYPYERWNLDFGKKLDAVAYYAYDNFQRSYYGKDMSEPMMSIEEFRKNPLFIIDCSHQPDTLKSSTVDIKLEFETRQSKFPSNTKAYYVPAVILVQTVRFCFRKRLNEKQLNVLAENLSDVESLEDPFQDSGSEYIESEPDSDSESDIERPRKFRILEKTNARKPDDLYYSSSSESNENDITEFAGKTVSMATDGLTRERERGGGRLCSGGRRGQGERTLSLQSGPETSESQTTPKSAIRVLLTKERCFRIMRFRQAVWQLL